MSAVEELLAEPRSGRLGVMVRHAPREPITSARAVLDAQLTPEGVADSREFGRRLARHGPVVLWHSPIPRCVETAGAALDGVRAAGGEGRVSGMLGAIGGPYLTDPAGAMREFVKDRNAFVRRWFDGGYPRTLVLPRDETAHLQLAGMAAAWQAETAARLAVFVSHDLNLLAIREQLLGVRHEEGGWIPCLDGLWLVLEATELVVGGGGRVARVPLGQL